MGGVFGGSKKKVVKISKELGRKVAESNVNL